ncbi:MAG: N-acetylmuramoyl-L-alanine amidase [Bacillota bacterium]
MKRSATVKLICTVLAIGLSLLFAAGSLALPTLSVGVLSYGSYGEEVEQLQAVLSELGFFEDEADGLYDANTVAAVKLLQKRLAVTPDGVFGPKTRTAYNAMVSEGGGEKLMNSESKAAPSTKALAGKLIGIDPGHQTAADLELEPVRPGSDESKVRMSVGATGVKTGMEEYKIVLQIGLKLKRMLEEAGAKVVLSRTSNDVSLSNIERAQLMNDVNVDLWVRLHCDRASSSEQSGARVLVPSRSSNASIYQQSLELGKDVLWSFCSVTGAKKRTVVARSDQTGFNWSKRPVIAIEMGYLSNVNDDLKLNRDSYQELCAQGIFEGILEYYSE